MDLTDLFERLEKSSFRRQFRLNAKDAGYLSAKGLPLVLGHARDFLTERLGAAEPLKDGAQTPMRGHPVFVAQHATATCCRGCTLKWHNIEKGRPLTAPEVDRLVTVIGEWLMRQTAVEPAAASKSSPTAKAKKSGQLSFF